MAQEVVGRVGGQVGSSSLSRMVVGGSGMLVSDWVTVVEVVSKVFEVVDGVVAVAVFIVASVVVQVTITLVKAIRRAKHCGVMLQKLPQQDPPHDSDGE